MITMKEKPAQRLNAVASLIALLVVLPVGIAVALVAFAVSEVIAALTGGVIFLFVLAALWAYYGFGDAAADNETTHIS